jgi:hypothetical protein
MGNRTLHYRWLKWIVPAFALWQVGACTTDTLVQSLQNEIVFSASSAVFTAAQTIAMNWLNL